MVGGVAPSNTERQQTPSKNLAVFSTVLRIIAGFRKVRIRVFEQFIFVPVAYLTLQIRLALRGRHGGFLFDCTLVQIAVWVFLFWHRLRRMRKSAPVLSPGPEIVRPGGYFRYRAAVTALTSV